MSRLKTNFELIVYEGIGDWRKYFTAAMRVDLNLEVEGVPIAVYLRDDQPTWWIVPETSINNKKHIVPIGPFNSVCDAALHARLIGTTRT